MKKLKVGNSSAPYIFANRIVLGSYWHDFCEIFAQEGLLNSLLKSVGLGSIKTDFLSSERGALLAIGITFIWSMVGTNIMIFLTGMSNLDVSLNEAAKLDGASTFEIFRKITLPQLKNLFSSHL